MPKNVIVALSGGPSPVINASLYGVIEGCRSYPDIFGTVYAGQNGVEGILEERLLNLSAQDPKEIQFLRTTPAAGSIGTCRYKLREKQQEDFDRIFDVFKAHAIDYFLYVGGNDSMDTAHKVSEMARERSVGLVAAGVPKTVDNDVGGKLLPDGRRFELIDHTPGYGSCARYWQFYIQKANEENRGSYPSDPVLVVQAMGRRIGFIPAAARLADPRREIPMQIYMTESGCSLEELAENVNAMLREHKRGIVVVSEGFDVGSDSALRDSFGHAQYSTGTPAAEVVTAYLNKIGLPVRGAARFNVPGTDQRGDIFYASGLDLKEAELVGRKAVDIAANEGTGYMATILREPGDDYEVRYDKVSLEAVANSERTFPQQWIAESRVDVTDDFLVYAEPLVRGDPEYEVIPIDANGLARFARLRPVMAEQKLGEYVPQAYR